MICLNGQPGVSQITPAVACGQEFAANPVLPLQNMDLTAGMFGGCNGGHETGSASAQNGDDHRSHLLNFGYYPYYSPESGSLQEKLLTPLGKHELYDAAA